MGRPREKKKKEPQSRLQAIFIKRVFEELARQGISQNQLSQRERGPDQKTLNDVLNGADPRLKTVQQIALALDVPAISLLTESTATIHHLPGYPPIENVEKGEKSHRQDRDRKRGRG